MSTQALLQLIEEKIEAYNQYRIKAENSEIYNRMVDCIDVLEELLEEF